MDGFVNLFVNAKAGFLFLLTPALLFLYRDRLDGRERKVATGIVAGCFFYAAVLIYGLSIDPKPRMMYVPLAGLALVLGLVAVRAWNLFLGLVFLVLLVPMLVTYAAEPRSSHWERAAERLLTSRQGQVETSQSAYFRFHEELSALPPVGSGKPYLMVLKSEACASRAPEDPVDIASLSVVAEERGRALSNLFGQRWSLCLYRYDGAPPTNIRDDRFQWDRRVHSPSAIRGEAPGS